MRPPADADLRQPRVCTSARLSQLQMKISGCWRTADGAQTSAALRSYVSTARKNGIAVLDALTNLLAGNPRLPATI